MSIRDILVPVDGTPPSLAALETGFLLAKIFESHVHVLHVRALAGSAIPVLGEGLSATVVQELVDLAEQQVQARSEAARRLYAEVRARAGVVERSSPPGMGASACFEECDGREDDETVRRGRVADLIVVPRPTLQSDSTQTITFSAIVFETGGPVLVSPPEPPDQPEFVRHITIAWNDTTEAARALRAAKPFLSRAQSVRVVSALESESEEQSYHRVLDYLAWQGISAESHLIPNNGFAGDALVEASAGSDLIVLGAYTHSRLWQLVLGSVTQHMLKHTTVPLLIAH